MKTLLAILGLCISVQAQLVAISTSKVASVAAATPGFVSHTQAPSTETQTVTTRVSGTTTCADHAYCFQMPQGSLAGNSLIIGLTYGAASSVAVTVTDDKSNTWTHVSCEASDTTNSPHRWADIYYTLAPTTGTQAFKATFASDVTQVEADVLQAKNLGSYDTCHSGGSTSSQTTWSAGAQTTTQDKDLVFMVGAATTNLTNTGSFTAGSGYTLATADQRDGYVSQWKVVSPAGSETPSATISAGSAYVAVAASFKSTTAGTDPTGMYVACSGSYNTASTVTNGTAIATQMPCPVGNLIAMSVPGGTSTGTQANSIHISSVTDAANSWSECGTFHENTSGAGHAIVDVWYAPNATLAGTEAPTFNFTSGGGATGDVSLWWYVLAGASTVGQCTSAQSVDDGGGTGATHTLAFTSYQPQASAGFSIAQMSQATNTSISVTAPTGASFDASTQGGENLSGPWPADENNFRGSYLFSSNAAQTWTATQTSASQDVGGSAVMAASFPSATAIAVVQGPLTNTGTTGTTLTQAITVQKSGDTLIVLPTIYHSSGTQRTVSKVCLDGGTCGAGKSFSQATSAAATGTTSQGASDIWYLIGNTNTGAQTITVTYSGAGTSTEVSAYEVANIASFDIAGHINNGSVASSTCSGQTISTGGNPGFLAAVVTVSDQVNLNPMTGNEFTGPGFIFSGSGDAVSSMVSAATGNHQPKWGDNSGTCNSSVAAFK